MSDSHVRGSRHETSCNLIMKVISLGLETRSAFLHLSLTPGHSPTSSFDTSVWYNSLVPNHCCTRHLLIQKYLGEGQRPGNKTICIGGVRLMCGDNSTGQVTFLARMISFEGMNSIFTIATMDETINNSQWTSNDRLCMMIVLCTWVNSAGLCTSLSRFHLHQNQQHQKPSVPIKVGSAQKICQ